MKWNVEATHAATGEEMILAVEAGTREQAAALARERGFFVRDCYLAGRGFYKGVRTVAWVWLGIFAFQTVVAILCGFGGAFQTAGDSGVKSAFVTVAVVGVLAGLGLLVARAMTDALRRDSPPDPRRGFDVVPSRDAAATPGVRATQGETRL